MADQKMTRAQKTASERSGKNQKTPAKTKAAPEQMSIREPRSELSVRLISAGVYLLLFVVFLVIAIQQQGLVLTLVRNLTWGLFGGVAFYLAIPTFFLLFLLQFSSLERPVMGRCLCALGFVFLCGSVSHLTICRQPLGSGWAIAQTLYQGGIQGFTGGVLCGGIGEVLKAMFGEVLSLILLVLGGVLCLLAAFRITIPSLIQAFRDRPRFEDEEERRPPQTDPSTRLVHSAVEQHHRHKQRQRQRRLEQKQEGEQALPKPRTSRKAVQVIPQQEEPEIPDRTGSWDLLREIQGDIDTRVPQDKPEQKPEEASVTLPWDVQDNIQKQVHPEDQDVSRGLAAEEGEAISLDREADDQLPPPAKKTPQGRGKFALAEPTPIITEKKVSAKDAAAAAEAVADEIARNSAEERPVYTYPPVNLLHKATGSNADGTQEMRENTRRLNETLASFKIEAHISNVTRGPSVTRYEVELEKGVRLNKLTSCADDIALSLGASGVRIAPVPGKISVVGIEVPNLAVTTVPLREVVDSPEFTRARSHSSFAVGKDISGNCIVGNIAKLPHMLIAGTTGSGKSVCMNSIIISLLYKSSPEDVKLIMVDPKMVELGIYNGIPHLLIPVVTDPKKAAGSLQWAVSEMMRRYRAMSDAGVRDLESYNSMIDGQELEGEHLPQVVVIIDELADLMLVAAKEVEESICRIAQMGRAAGIHLIIATQRPSADVITGLMKANIPSRIAFAVASAMESRIILDTQGAEKLVGKGDMLYAPIGCGKPIRVQGCFVTDEEVEAITNFIKENYTTSYDQSVMEEIERSAVGTGSKGSNDTDAVEEEAVLDEMLVPAAEVVLETGQASVSMLQRRLKLGYARAARIMDLMEELEIVGPYAGSKPRNILKTREQWEEIKQHLTGQPSMELEPPPAGVEIPMDPEEDDTID